MGPNGFKCVQMGPNKSKLIQYILNKSQLGSNRAKIVDKLAKVLKTVRYCQILIHHADLEFVTGWAGVKFDLEHMLFLL